MKITPTIKILAVGILFLYCTSAFSQQTADINANQTSQCILQYLSGLSAQPDNKVISGQWMNYRGLPETPFTEFDTVITALYNQTSEWVGIIGTNYTRFHTAPFYTAIENMNQVNQPLINYSRQNGLIFVMANFKNPWNQTNSNDLTNSSNLLDVVTNGHLANSNFNKELDSLALGFSQLQDSNVTIIFRPFHEMNGNWFWWGSKTSTLPVNSDYTALWNYIFNYLTNVKELHNILWCYAPSARESSVGNPAFKSELFYYPGDSLVDIIGLDIYNDTLDIPNYNSIVALNKPVGIAEFGPRKQTVQNNPNVYDYTILINQIKNKYPSLCYWVSWNHFKNASDWIFYSMATQSNTIGLLTDSWVVNRDEINYTSPPVNDASTISGLTIVCQGQSGVTYSVSPMIASMGYSWSLPPGASVTSGANSNSITVDFSGSATSGSIIATPLNGCASSTSSISLPVTVHPYTVASVSISANSVAEVCPTTSMTFTATPENGGSFPLFQWKINNINTGSNSSTYINNTWINNDTITCIMTSDAICVSGSPATSNKIGISVNPGVAASVSIEAAPTGPICAGSSVTFTAIPVNSGITPVYQWKKNNLNAGANSATYIADFLLDNDSIVCVMTSNATCVTGNPALSNEIVIKIYACTVTVNLKAFMEGFYIIGADSMVAVIDPINHPALSDTLTLQLSDSATQLIVATDRKVLSTSGQASFYFEGLLPGHKYYLILKHRNSIEIWSKQPFIFENDIFNLDLTR